MFPYMRFHYRCREKLLVTFGFNKLTFSALDVSRAREFQARKDLVKNIPWTGRYEISLPPAKTNYYWCVKEGSVNLDKAQI